MRRPDPRLETFRILTNEAEALVEAYEVDQIPAFEAALQFVEANPDLRPQFGRAFLNIIDQPETDGEFFRYCMHALRWPEVRAAVEARMKQALGADERARHFYSSALQSFEDDYSGAFYGRFAVD